jgi:uncharacterized protein YacL
MSPLELLDRSSGNVVGAIALFSLFAAALAQDRVAFRRWVIKTIEYFSLFFLFFSMSGAAIVGFNFADLVRQWFRSSDDTINPLVQQFAPLLGAAVGVFIGFLLAAFVLFFIFLLVDIAENTRRTAAHLEKSALTPTNAQ